MKTFIKNHPFITAFIFWGLLVGMASLVPRETTRFDQYESERADYLSNPCNEFAPGSVMPEIC